MDPPANDIAQNISYTEQALHYLENVACAAFPKNPAVPWLFALGCLVEMCGGKPRGCVDNKSDVVWFEWDALITSSICAAHTS